MRASIRTILLIPAAVAAMAQTPPEWVTRSNQNTQILIDIDSKYSPEDASENGVRGFDDQVTVFTADLHQRVRADYLKARDLLNERLAAEKDPLVKQDLEILIHSADESIRGSEANYNALLPYYNVGRIIYSGIQGLLDEQVDAARRPAAVARLKKYTGLTKGYTPMTQMAEARFRERLQKGGLLGPPKEEIEKDLADTGKYTTGIGLLMEKFHQKDYQDALARLKTQLDEYDAFLRREVLPKARTDFRLPSEIYQLRLENAGVDYTPAELEKIGHAGFTEIQNEMKPIAARIAEARKLPSSDYRM